MRISDLADTTADAVRSAGTYLEDLTTPTLRLGVTGLSRAGKTVFITALVHALTEGTASPALMTEQLPGFRAFLEPQPDDDIPRFAYERHLEALASDPPQWPLSTRQLSQLRLTLEWAPRDWIRQTAGIGRRLHLDIVDYPGEWLLDLGLLSQSYADWAAMMSARAGKAPRDARVENWHAFVAAQQGASPADEQVALRGAELFTALLASLRDNDRYQRLLTPGRFLMPGDLEGSPLLTFFPLPAEQCLQAKPGSLSALLERRFESYKSQVVRPFFERHFRALDRQVVLVDALAALNGGANAMMELETALDSALGAFRPGPKSWLAALRGRHIDRVTFAATKADHIHVSNHVRLRALMRTLLSRAADRAKGAGAEIEIAAIAALRATEDVEYTAGSSTIPCIRGRPIAGQQLNGKTFDGQTATAIFPGDLPDDPLDIFDREALQSGSLNFVRFVAPQLPNAGNALHAAPWPHVGLDHVVRSLIGDRLI
ncbi:MAG: YcjX family protein [Hyphomicrobiaceae bacterium]